MSEISDRIAEDALKPQSTSVDGTSITRRPAADQIAADNHTRAAAATAPSNMAATLRGMMFKIVSPGANG